MSMVTAQNKGQQAAVDIHPHLPKDWNNLVHRIIVRSACTRIFLAQKLGNMPPLPSDFRARNLNNLRVPRVLWAKDPTWINLGSTVLKAVVTYGLLSSWTVRLLAFSSKRLYVSTSYYYKVIKLWIRSAVWRCIRRARPQKEQCVGFSGILQRGCRLKPTEYPSPLFQACSQTSRCL